MNNLETLQSEKIEGLILHRSGVIVDIRPRNFHGYTVKWSGEVVGKKGKILKLEKRERRGGGFDYCVRLYYNKKSHKWTLQRLIADCFLGNIHGMEINHVMRNTSLNGGDDIEILTRSKNQRHWRDDEEIKKGTIYANK